MISHWKFELTGTHLLIRTPWFAFYWSEYNMDLLRYGYWRGFSLHWKPNKNVKEGECYFLKEFEMRVDFLDADDLFSS